MAHRRQPPLVRDALAHLAAHGFIGVADVSGRCTSSDGRERTLTLPKDPHGSANVTSLARLCRALQSDGASQ
jgi:hypothetical protein